tara:strand:- start:375 stop:1064 length:690 start_codon:yes stop_codon:yes gene_type:complete
MKKIFVFFILFLLGIGKSEAHSSNYKGIKLINMDVFRNGKLIGYSNYFFTHGKNTLEVKNYTKFKVKLLELTIFSISGESLEKYKNGKLISYESSTFQNDKEKYVKLQFDEVSNNFVIEGSSFKGKASADALIGSWWNHEILKVDKQISPISGSVKKQIVKFIGTEKIKINKKDYILDRYKLVSKNNDLPEDKRLDFDIWLNSKNNLIYKILYNRVGIWEYRIKNFEID